MVVQNIKSENNIPNSANYQTTKEFTNGSRIKSDVLCKCMIVFFLLLLLTMNIMFICLTTNNITKITRLQDQIDALQQDVDKYQLFHDNLLQKISHSEFESYADKNNMKYEEKEDGRSKREILRSDLDGLPIIQESSAKQKMNNTNYGTIAPVKQYKTTLHKQRDSVKPTEIVSYADEDKSKQYRKIVKKSLTESANPQEHVESFHVTVTPSTPRRGHRHGGGRASNKCSGHLETENVIAAHYNGNTSHLSSKHHGYRGNGHFAHPQGLYMDWQPSSWVSSLGAERTLQFNQGEVVVRESGLYFVYAQIYYVDEHDINGFQILINGHELAQCTTMTHTERKLDKRNSCWTGTLAILNDGDHVSVRDIETHRYAYMAHGKSFFGLIKLADFNNARHQHHTHIIK